MAILNFCVKCKNVFISETERDKAILTKILTRRLSAEYIGNFLQKLFSRHHIGGHLEFLRLTQKRLYLGNGVRYSDFDENFDTQAMSGVYWRLFAKIVFPPLLAAISNFCVKRKNVFISVTERDRVI